MSDSAASLLDAEPKTRPVWVGRASEKQPTFHLWGRPDYSLCGLVLGDLAFGLCLRLDHARKFAKPCSKCLRRMSDAF